MGKRLLRSEARGGAPQSSSSPGGSPPARPWSLIILAAAIVLAGLLSFSPALDGDVWWHLATGRWIVEGGGIPKTDLFTYTASGRPWVAHEWLSEVLFHFAERMGGIDLLIALKALLAALAVGLSALAALVVPRSREDPSGAIAPGRPLGADTLAFERLPGAAAGALLAALLIAPRAFVRPHMLTALLLGALLLVLRLESTTGRRMWRCVLPPLFLLWANLHAGFVLGFALWMLYWAGEALSGRRGDPGSGETPAGRQNGTGPAERAAGQPRRARPHAHAPAPELHPAPLWRERGLALLLALAASLINPNFVQAHLYPFHLIAREEVRGTIVELRNAFHPAYRGAWFVKALAAAGLAFVLLLFDARKRLQWSLLLPGMFFAALALASVRGLNEFAVLLPAVLGAHAGPLGHRRRLAPAVSIGTLALALACGAFAIARGMPVGQGVSQRIGLGTEPGSIPVSAARFLRETRPAGRVFNLLSYGGYLIYEVGPRAGEENRAGARDEGQAGTNDELPAGTNSQGPPGIPVFIDGRLDVFPSGFLASYTRMLESAAGWDEAVQRYGIAIAIVNHIPDPARDRGLRARLRTDPNWACVLAGDYTLVYARRTAENAGILARYAIPFDPSARHEDFIGAFTARASAAEIERALASLANMHEIAPEEIAPTLFAGQILDRLGRSAEAAARVREALRLDPRSSALRLYLAETLERAGSLDEARNTLAAILVDDPENAPALSLLGLVERGAGHAAQALQALEKAAALAPADAVVQIRLGVVKAEAGRYAEARRHLQRALMLRPGDPGALRNLRALEALEAQPGGAPAGNR